MPEGGGQQSAESAGSSERPGSLPPLPTASEELARVDLRPTPLYDLGADHRKRLHEAAVKERETHAEQADDDRKLRRMIAGRVFWAISVQVAIADFAFLTYGFWNGWEIPGSTISAWLGATVVQVIAVGVVITRSLFPTTPKEDATVA